MANVQITQLPNAGPITGTEAVPIVQNGVTVQTTTANIAGSPTLTASFLEATLSGTTPNARYLTFSSGLTYTDNGAGSNYNISLDGAVNNFNALGNGLVAKTGTSTLANRTITAGTVGLSVSNGDGVSGNPSISLTGLPLTLAQLVGSGVLTYDGSTINPRTITGTSNQITVTNGTGSSGDPTIAIANNAIFPGTASVQVPSGTTVQRPAGINGQVRYNTDLSIFEFYENGAWVNYGVGDGTVTSVTGTTNEITVVNSATTPIISISNNPIIPGTGAITLPSGTTAQRAGSDGALRYNSQTGTFEGYANGAWGSIVTGSGVTSVATGTGLLGGPITSTGTITIDNTVVATLSDAQTLTNKTISGASNTLTNIDNASLTNSAITINGSSVSLGGSITVTATASNALTIGTGLTGSSYNGSIPVTIAIDSSVVTLTGSQTLTNKTLTTPVISSITNTGTLTLPTSTDTLVGRATTDTLTNKSISGSSNTITNIGNSSLTNSSVTIGTTAISLGGSSLTLGGLTSVTVTQDPSANLDLATKQYVDNLASTGLLYHDPVQYATTADLGTVLYNNGASGVGATLTKTAPFSTLTIDGHTFTSPADIGARILVKDETNQAYNGVYDVVSVGSGASAWQLIRSADADTYGTGTGDLSQNDYFFVQNGTANKGNSYVVTTIGTITFGTTNITFAQFSTSQVYSAGTGLTLTDTTFSITNTGVTASTYGSASSVPVIAFNAQGQATSVTDTSIAINGNQITSGTVGSSYISGSYTGITGVGTLTAGTWNANTIGVGYGGTGLSTYTTGDILYASGSTTLSKLGIGTTNYVLTSSGSAPQYVAQSTLSVGSATTATTATNLAGGSASQIPYQSGSGTTSFIANGTAGQVLTSAGSGTPVWSGISGGTF